MKNKRVKSVFYWIITLSFLGSIIYFIQLNSTSEAKHAVEIYDSISEGEEAAAGNFAADSIQSPDDEAAAENFTADSVQSPDDEAVAENFAADSIQSPDDEAAAENFAADSIQSPDDEAAGWELVLVNYNHPIDAGYPIQLKNVGNGYSFDARAAIYLETMMADAREEGLSPAICSAYRSRGRQTQLYKSKVSKLMKKGFSKENAEDRARREVAYPGTSEHELGLAVDIVSDSYSKLDSGFARTKEAKWLADNCHKYGFILRYPEDKVDTTEIIYEPWHFRYVGVEAATEIMENDLCLEEYLQPEIYHKN